MSNHKLGKLAPRLDSRTLKFKTYLTKLPPIPAAIDWTGKVKTWPMFLNDSIGICTIAGGAHLEMGWSSYAAPNEAIPTDQQVLAAYSAITGYTPSDPSTDTGADLLTVLNYWRKQKIAGHGIKYYAQIALNSQEQLQASIALMGGAYIGVNLPQSAEDAFQAGQPWTDTTDKNILGGHCIVLVGYDPTYVTAVTWGATVKISYAWLNTYMDEAYAIISPQWVEAGGVNTPTGLNLTQLEADLAAI